jgi:hypothetical protein
MRINVNKVLFLSIIINIIDYNTLNKIMTNNVHDTIKFFKFAKFNNI